jgi:hypothetical protein
LFDESFSREFFTAFYPLFFNGGESRWFLSPKFPNVVFLETRVLLRLIEALLRLLRFDMAESGLPAFLVGEWEV